MGIFGANVKLINVCRGCNNEKTIHEVTEYMKKIQRLKK